MKRYISLILIIISILLIGVGLFYPKNSDNEFEPKNDIVSIDEASKLLYTTYLLTEDDQYYSFIREDDEYYYFEVVNSKDETKYMVNKKTKEILFLYNSD